jgi:hypothetical protein
MLIALEGLLPLWGRGVIAYRDSHIYLVSHAD